MYFLLLKLFQLWSLGALSVGSCVSLTYSHPCILDTSLLSDTTRYLFIPCPCSSNSHFDWRMVSTEILLLLSPFSWVSKEIYIGILTWTYMHSYKYLFTCTYLYWYLAKYEFILIFHYHFSFHNSNSLLCGSI